jgi:hypothetical protein
LIADPGWAGIDPLSISDHTKILLGSGLVVDYQKGLINLHLVTRYCGKALDIMRARALLSLASLMNSFDTTGVKDKHLTPAWPAKIVGEFVYKDEISSSRKPGNGGMWGNIRKAHFVVGVNLKPHLLESAPGSRESQDFRVVLSVASKMEFCDGEELEALPFADTLQIASVR